MADLSEQYGSYEEYAAAVEAATNRLNRGKATAYDMALIQELIASHAGFVALVECEMLHGRK